MLWFIIWAASIVLVVITGSVLGEFTELNLDWMWTLLGWTIFGGFVVAVALNLFFDAHNRIPEDRYTNLVSMGDAAGVQGRFFLGSGSVDTAPVYMYYTKTERGYRLYHKRSAQSYITYTDETPILVHHGSRQGYSNWFSIHADDWRIEQYDSGAFEFKIPPGSIAQQFDLDAQ